jgi:hypothetical protein
MRSPVLIIAALAFATAAGAAPEQALGPYTLDSHGKCRAASGHEVLPRLCHPPTHCKDPKTHKAVDCKTPGAVSAD